jgi:hypothetical protein
MVKKIGKVEEPDVDKPEWIKLEFILIVNNEEHLLFQLKATTTSFFSKLIMSSG